MSNTDLGIKRRDGVCCAPRVPLDRALGMCGLGINNDPWLNSPTKWYTYFICLWPANLEKLINVHLCQVKDKMILGENDEC